MSDYINKEDAKKWLINLRDDCGKYQDMWHYAEALNQIIELLSADVEPVRHGKWEATEWAVNSSGEILIGRIYRCSECGRIIDLEHGETLDDYPYCHCGAKMDGEVIKNE